MLGLWHNAATSLGFMWKEPSMKEVGVREFRDHASGYLSGDEALAVSRHGRVIGYYLPVKKRDEEKLRSAMLDARESLEELRRETGLSEEELVEELVPDKHEVRERRRVGG